MAKIIWSLLSVTIDAQVATFSPARTAYRGEFVICIVAIMYIPKRFSYNGITTTGAEIINHGA